MFSFSWKFVLKLKFWPLNVTLKHDDLLMGGLFWKSLALFFRRTYTFFGGFKNETFKKKFSGLKTKANPNVAVKLAVRSNHSFLLFIWKIIFFKYLLLIRDNGIHRTYWEHDEKQPNSHSCTELSKTQFLPVSIVIMFGVVFFCIILHAIWVWCSLLTPSVPEKLRSLILEMPIIPQTLSINN